MQSAETSRSQPSSLHPFLARCICVTTTFICLGCAVLGFGAACLLLDDAPCPDRVLGPAFGAGGALVLIGAFLLCGVCRSGRRMKLKSCLEELEAGVPQYVRRDSAEKHKGGLPDESGQKSVDVSYWIEQQKSPTSSTSETFSLERTSESAAPDHENTEGEMTAL